MMKHLRVLAFGLALLAAGPALAQGTVKSLGAESKQTPAVTASAAYASGNCIGGLIAASLAPGASGLTGVAMPSGGSGTALLTDMTLTDASAQSAAINAWVFTTLPAGTYTDKTACTLNASDVAKRAGVVQISSYISDPGAATSIATVTGIAMNLQLGTGGQTVWVQLVSNGATPTYTATTALTLKLRLLY